MAHQTDTGFRRISATWNPLTGCTKISPGCQHCYAEALALRLQRIGAPKYSNGFALTLHEDAMDLPLRWKKPRFIFVNSMSDVFHKDVPEDYIGQMFAVMRRCPQHQFMILTKRSDRLRALSPRLPWTPNVWMGVSVENDDYRFRVDDLRATGARVKFLSIEPLLGPLPDLDLSGMDWAFVGGESGPKARPMCREWVTDVRDQCRRAGIAFSFHQWGGADKYQAGRLLDGEIWDEMPSAYYERPPTATGQLALFD